jgi:hypothetical protein
MKFLLPLRILILKKDEKNNMNLKVGTTFQYDNQLYLVLE